jgi:hypothetical protein
MHYEIMLRDKKGEPYYYEDYILPGIFPESTFEAMHCEVAESLGLCEKCDVQGARCHVLVHVVEYEFQKLCPILFHDVVKPRWQIAEIV